MSHTNAKGFHDDHVVRFLVGRLVAWIIVGLNLVCALSVRPNVKTSHDFDDQGPNGGNVHTEDCGKRFDSGPVCCALSGLSSGRGQELPSRSGSLTGEIQAIAESSQSMQPNQAHDDYTGRGESRAKFEGMAMRLAISNTYIDPVENMAKTRIFLERLSCSPDIW